VQELQDHVVHLRGVKHAANHREQQHN
jgi:hypothetical protein